IAAARIFTVQPNTSGLRGACYGLQVAVVGNECASIALVAVVLVTALENDPRFVQPRRSVEPTQPQLSGEIDRERASDLGIDIAGLANAVQSVLDGRKIGSVYVGDRSFDVKLVSTTNPINDPTDLENVFLRSSDGRYVPMSSIATAVEK